MQLGDFKYIEANIKSANIDKLDGLKYKEL